MKQRIKSLLGKMGYTIGSTKYMLKQVLADDHILKMNFDHVLGKYLFDKPAGEPFNFIQVGAFDGIEVDPLRKYILRYDWRGVMMEPQPLPYSRLKKEYENRPQLKILNSALSKEKGQASLYVLEGDGIPEWSKGMASFNRDNILKHKYLIPDLESYVKKIDINTVTFAEIFQSAEFTHLDLLQTDTEGFDAEIIFMFPFDKIKPSIIHFESKHISKPTLEKLLDHLISLGYYVAYDREEDMMAVLAK